MPTARGWSIVATGVALWVAGRLFGASVLEQLGFALIVLVIIAVVVVRMARHDLEVVRTVSPARTGAGRTIALNYRVTNGGRGPAPLVLLEDRLPSSVRGAARFALNGLEPDGSRAASITLRPVRRGRYEIGPLSMIFVDPFRLARRRSTAADTTHLIVHPRVETLTMPRDTGERRSAASAALRQPTVARGEDFFTLREYAEGDDLRKVHWPSTAKRGRYMIRQEETPWHTRATIVFDDRAAAHGGAGESSSFERVVEAVASLADLYHRSGHAFRVLGAHQPGITTGKGAGHMARIMDLLAVAPLSGGDEDRALAEKLSDVVAGGTAEASLVVVAGSLLPADAIAIAAAARRFRSVVTISYPAHRFGAADTKQRWAGEQASVEVARLLERSSIRALLLGPGDMLGPAWRGTGGPRMAGTWIRKPEPV